MAKSKRRVWNCEERDGKSHEVYYFKSFWSKKDISKHFLNSSDNEVFSEEERTRQSSYDESSGLSEWFI